MEENGKSNFKNIMKNNYIKTTWIDNKTPVNAANLNKIESALYDIYTNALSTSEILEGDGIHISDSSCSTDCYGNGGSKGIQISVSDRVMQSDSCRGIDIVTDQSSILQFEKDRLYLFLNPETKSLVKIMINGVTIFEV